MKRRRAAPHSQHQAAASARPTLALRPAQGSGGSAAAAAAASSATAAAATPVRAVHPSRSLPPPSSFVRLRSLAECVALVPAPAAGSGSGSSAADARMVSFLAVVSSLPQVRVLPRRDGSGSVRLTTLLLSDRSARHVLLKLWGDATDSGSKDNRNASANPLLSTLASVRVGQVLLCHQVQMSRFRHTVSASAKTGLTRLHLFSDCAEEANAGTEHEGQAHAKMARTNEGDFRSARNPHLRLPLAGARVRPPFATFLSNWAEIVAAATALQQWARTEDVHMSILLQSAAATLPAAPAVASADNAADDAAAGASPAPISSLFGLSAGHFVTVQATLRSVRFSSPKSAASGGTTARAVGPPGPVCLLVLGECDGDVEALVELELRDARWAEPEYQRLWRQAATQIRSLRVENVRVQAHSLQQLQQHFLMEGEGLQLRDTASTRIRLLDEAEPTDAHASSSSAHQSADTPVDEVVLRSAFLRGVHFPLLTPEQHQELFSLVLRAASGGPGMVAVPPLPPPLFAALFYSGCAWCAAVLSPDHDGVLQCQPCFTRISLSQARDLAQGQVKQVEFMYRDARLLLRQEGQGGSGDAQQRQQLLSSSVLACHAALIELFGHIEPECLRAAASATVPCTPEPTAAASVHSHVHPSELAPSLLQLQRMQWYRLLLPLLQGSTQSLDSVDALSCGEPVRLRLHWHNGSSSSAAARALLSEAPAAVSDPAPLVAGVELWAG